MALSKEKKGQVIERLKKIWKSPSVVFVQFHTLTVARAQALRRALRAFGSGYFVAKKTLIRKSLEGTPIEGDAPVLEGEIGVSYMESGEDLTAPAREVFGFGNKAEHAVRLVGGIFEGRFIGMQEALSLAAIPPRQTLLAQFVNLVNSPIQRLVVGLDQIAKKRI